MGTTKKTTTKPRPAHYVADEGQVLTLAGDGTVSQAPASEATDAR